MHKLCSVLFFVLLTAQFPDSSSFSYNVNARSEFVGGGVNDHSYFGYSVMLRDGNRPLLIVGAPRDSSSYNPSIKDPGGVFICNIQLNNNNQVVCQKKPLENDGNSRYFLANGRPYHHKKDNMWLGMTLAGTDYNNGTFIACAPRWINQLHNEYHLGNGLCYSIAHTDSYKVDSEISTLIPLIEKHSQGFSVTRPEDRELTTTYYFAYGEAGMSLKLSDDASEVLIGAPGVYVWTGTVARYRITKQFSGKDYFMKKPIQNPFYTTELGETSYFGYSVDSGKFISNRANLYVAGAPRGAEYKGQVLLFDFPVRENSRYIIFAILEGHQLGEYFGATLAAIDINQDGLKDLLVSAPMYAQKYSSDQGRVYVYMNHDKGKLVEQDVTIAGDLNSGARFGTSISSIGDIDGDGFSDVAIGAPYEDNGKGAVYIYLGSSKGLNPTYSQRITVSDSMGFGISISKGIDIDKNSCNDIAVGAYESAKAYLLRCHPSIGISSKMEANPSEISFQETNFTLQICFSFVGTTLSKTDINVSLLVDKEHKRAKLENAKHESFLVSGFTSHQYCQDFLILIDVDESDFSRPIDINMEFALAKNPLNDTKFCMNCAVLRPSTETKMLLRVPFASGCGDDLVCQPDLKISVKLLEKTPYVIGSTSSFTLNVSVTNVGEPAFLARVELIPPAIAPILRVPPKCRLTESSLICEFDNPLLLNAENYVLLELDTSSLTSGNTLLSFNVTTQSGGEEQTPEDNNFNVTIPLETQANIILSGQGSVDSYIYINPNVKNYNNTTMSHAFEVQNAGPTSLDSFKISFFIPVAYMDEKTNVNFSVINVFEPKDQINQAPFLCRALNGNYYVPEKTEVSVDLFNGPDEAAETTTNDATTFQTVSYNENSARNFKSRELFYSEIEDIYTSYILPTEIEESASLTKTLSISCLDTQRVTCMVVNCIKSEGLPAGSNVAHMIFNTLLNVTNIETILKTEKTILLSTYAVTQGNVYGSARSLVIGGAPPPPPTPIWVIILAVLFGVLLLALISFILYKVNFFSRKTRAELELLKNQENSQIDNMEDD